MVTQTTQPITRSRRASSGFTLIELLAVVFIVVVMMGIIFPVINAMKNGSRITAGINTVSMSSDVARQWVKQLQWAPDTAGPTPNARYSGTAAIFCPTGEVRIVRNAQRAQTPGGAFLEEGGSGVLNHIPGHGINGYEDRTEIEYISIPQGSGLAGVYRNGNGAQLIAPPFAIAYDQNGHMIQGSLNNLAGNDDRYIYYNSDFVNGYDIADVRGGGYDPADWDGSNGSNNANAHATLLVKALPFDAIETVIGIIVYNEADFKAAFENNSATPAGFDMGGSIVNIPDNSIGDANPDPDADPYDWIRANGETIFFSPHTGVALRDEGLDN